MQKIIIYNIKESYHFYTLIITEIFYKSLFLHTYAINQEIYFENSKWKECSDLLIDI